MLQKHMNSCLLCGWGWEMVGCYCAMNLNWQKLSTIFSPTLFLEVASYQWIIPEFQNRYITQIPPVQMLSRWETDSWCFLLLHLTFFIKILNVIFFTHIFMRVLNILSVCRFFLFLLWYFGKCVFLFKRLIIYSTLWFSFYSNQIMYILNPDYLCLYIWLYFEY